ncbi:hypothetical protein B0G80_8684 [Paraburkholderia sp. BL6669N2]|uniref:hypothetical protein n=1 Tax=Paraburkholderia sp. BL6669N2 TaxID=1938807 RepID=UPI000E2814B7|nr:hypothetical protein [Paraburkholderia sp. BL6669N2]REG52161.1 hypothetical protein B0G80_8684 [Paraburkholderia sp. BL6669N2]
MQPLMSVESVNQDSKHTVRIAIDDAAVLLGAEEVDAMIQHLSYIRAAMRPEVPKALSRAQQYVLEMDPCWHSEKALLYDGAVLILRHSGLGWVGFALPAHSLQKLRDAMTQHLAALAEEHCLPN